MMIQFSGVKVFSATMARDREDLGNVIAAWLKANPNIEIVDRVVLQSSDSEFHCISITLFFVERDESYVKRVATPTTSQTRV